MTARRRWWSAFASDVERLTYDFRSCEGDLHLPPACSADMSSVLDLFRGLDAEVRCVRIRAGDQPLVTYSRLGHVWDIEREPRQQQGPRRRSSYGRGRIKGEPSG